MQSLHCCTVPYLLDEGSLFHEVERALGPLVPVTRLNPWIHHLRRVRVFHLIKIATTNTTREKTRMTGAAAAKTPT